jgi:hypothetical protein
MALKCNAVGGHVTSLADCRQTSVTLGQLAFSVAVDNCAALRAAKRHFSVRRTKETICL